MPVQPEPDHNDILVKLVAGVATLITSFGIYLFKKINRVPPKKLTLHDYENLKKELKVDYAKDLQEAVEMLRELSSTLESDIQSIRGEMNQMNKRLAHQGGILKGLEERFSSM